MGCQRCQCQYDAPIPFCTTCSGDLLRAGLCSWCGEKPRKPAVGNRQQSKYCDGCQKEAAERSARILTPVPWRGPYRGDDARENIRETKYGRD